MIVECNHKKELFQNIFDFMNYVEFVLAQSIYYKNKNLGEYYTNAYCKIINDILEKTYDGSFHHYAKLKHIIDFKYDIKICIKNIKKRFLFGNQIDYRYLLLAQVLHACKMLDINLDENKLELCRKHLSMSKKAFNIAVEYAKNPNNIKEQKIQKTFEKYVEFSNKQNIYRNTPIRHIGICANISCGKSTFVNALLGNDFLPARNEATTACVTSVYDYDFATHLLGMAIKKNHTYSISDNADVSVVNAWNIQADHIILQADLDNISNENTIVAVHDTPGVNNSANDEHKKVTMEFFGNNKMDLILYVANAEHLATEDDKNLLVKLRDKILPKSKSKMLFVINKFDSIDISKESKDDIVIRYLEFLEDLGFEKPKIYPISSKAARLFKMALNGRVDLFSQNELDEFKPLVNKFNKRLNLAANNDVFYIKETIQRSLEFGESITLDGEEVEIQKIYQALKNTGLLGLESDIETLLSNDEMQRGNSTLPEIFFSKAK